MKKLILATVALVFIGSMPSFSMAGESDVCKGCHNGSVAPSIDTLKSKFKTADELVAAAKNVKNDMMKAVQSDDAKLKAAAAEIIK
jgi:hypothetical protein